MTTSRGVWVPEYFNWSSTKPNKHNESTLEFQLAPPAKSASLYHFVNQMFLTYKTIDEPQDLFKRLEEITVRQSGRVLHRLTSHIWSTMLVLQNKNFMKNRNDSKLYIPLTTQGLVKDISTDPVVVTVTFRNFQKEHERVGIFVQYSTCTLQAIATRTLQAIATRTDRALTSTKYWTLSNPIYVKMPTKPEQTTMDVVLPWVGTDISVGQVVFHIPGANTWIKSGLIKAVPLNTIDETKEKEIVVYEFTDPYEAVVVDKLFFDLPFPKSSLFTCTFINWQKEQAEYGIQTLPTHALVLHLDLAELPEDNKPKDATLEVFAIVGLPLNS